MKRLLFVLLILFIAANANGMAIGVIVGSPTALSLKLARIHLEFGYQGIEGGNTSLHFSYEIPFKIDFGNQNAIPMYFGVGLFSEFGSNAQMGVRFPIGINFWLAKNIVLFGEIVPAFSVLEKTGFVLFGGVGLRIHFNVKS